MIWEGLTTMTMNKRKKVSLTVMTVLLLGLTTSISTNAWSTSDKAAKAATKTEDKKTEQKEAAPAAPNNDWQLRCQDLKEGEKVTGKYCEAVQSLFVIQTDKDKKQSAQRIAELAIGYPPATKQKNAQAVAILPLGIVVNEKIIVEIDGSNIDKIETRFCDNGGCVALFELDKSALEKMRKGKEIGFRTKAASGQPVFIGLPLTAFDKAIDAIAPKK